MIASLMIFCQCRLAAMLESDDETTVTAACPTHGALDLNGHTLRMEIVGRQYIRSRR